jgi:hypothetical protein
LRAAHPATDPCLCPDNAIVHLAAAIAKLGEFQPPMRLNETTRTFFDRLSSVSPPNEALLYANILDPRKRMMRRCWKGDRQYQSQQPESHRSLQSVSRRGYEA